MKRFDFIVLATLISLSFSVVTTQRPKQNVSVTIKPDTTTVVALRSFGLLVADETGRTVARKPRGKEWIIIDSTATLFVLLKCFELSVEREIWKEQFARK